VPYTIAEEDMLIPGYHFGDIADTCYIPVFSNGIPGGDPQDKVSFIG
jgi:hypothetical protein